MNAANTALAAFDEKWADTKFTDDANYQWRIARRPAGNVAPDDFELVSAEIPEPGEGQVLLKTNYLNVAPLMRFYMLGQNPSGEGARQIGDLIPGRGVAQIAKSRHPDWREGDMVQGQMGWQTYCVSAMNPQEKMIPMPNNGLPAALGAGVLGMTGLSAHAGLFDCGNPKEGDLMVLSGAAGGVGSIVGQLAANVVGCDVVGVAGGAEKCALILAHGCSAAIDYKADDIEAKLDELRPDGIDLYFDNVGGETLEICLERLRMHSRIVLCGSISEYTRDEPFKLSNYTRLRKTESVMRGFFVYNHLHYWDRAMDELTGWIHDGKLNPVQDVEQGFQNMPKALANLYYGGNVGVQCASVRGEPDEWV